MRASRCCQAGSPGRTTTPSRTSRPGGGSTPSTIGAILPSLQLAAVTGASPLFDRVVQLAELLRRGGIQVSTGELIDACEALEHLDLLDRGALQAGLRAAMVKEPLGAA